MYIGGQGKSCFLRSSKNRLDNRKYLLLQQPGREADKDTVTYKKEKLTAVYRKEMFRGYAAYLVQGQDFLNPYLKIRARLGIIFHSGVSGRSKPHTPLLV